MAHFLLSMVLIAIATVVHHRVTRARHPASGAGDPAGDPGAAGAARAVGRVLPAVGALVLVLGTVVTATGPHAGDPGTDRLGVSIVTAARAHSLTVWVTVALSVVVLVAARRAGAGRLARAAGVLLAVELAQGAVGYWQYLTGVPPVLVLAHMLLATVFWVAVVRVGLVARTATAPAPADPVGLHARL
jgi:cytochrome c oxidase assembly protein subunit 15